MKHIKEEMKKKDVEIQNLKKEMEEIRRDMGKPATKTPQASARTSCDARPRTFHGRCLCCPPLRGMLGGPRGQRHHRGVCSRRRVSPTIRGLPSSRAPDQDRLEYHRTRLKRHSHPGHIIAGETVSFRPSPRLFRQPGRLSSAADL